MDKTSRKLFTHWWTKVGSGRLRLPFISIEYWAISSRELGPIFSRKLLRKTEKTAVTSYSNITPTEKLNPKASTLSSKANSVSNQNQEGHGLSRTKSRLNPILLLYHSGISNRCVRVQFLSPSNCFLSQSCLSSTMIYRPVETVHVFHCLNCRKYLCLQVHDLAWEADVFFRYSYSLFFWSQRLHFELLWAQVIRLCVACCWTSANGNRVRRF